MLLAVNPPQGQRQTVIQSKRLENNFLSKWSQKQDGVAILIWNKTDFQLKVIKKDKGVGIILIKDRIYQDEISILNIYAPNAKASTFIKDILVKLKTHIAHYNSGRLQQPSLINGQILETKPKQTHNKSNRNYETNGFS